MASPTPNKGYTYPAHNGSINTWDTPIDADFDQIDLNLGGTYNVTGSSSVATVTFNASQCIAASTANLVTFPTSIAQNMYYKVSGAFNSSCVLVWPAVGGFYVVNNQTSSGTIYAGISGNTANGAQLSANAQALVVADSSNMYNTDPAAAATFAAGTGVIFGQAAAPSGWTIDATVNDRALRIVSAAGGGTGGSWSISGLSISVGAHTLTTGEMPSHNHSYTQPTTNNSRASGSGGVCQSTTGANTGNTGGDGSHTHSASGSGDGSWRPAYYNVIRCTKN